MVELFLGRTLERDDLGALRIQSAHDVLDGAILPGRVDRLEDEQQRPLMLGV